MTTRNARWFIACTTLLVACSKPDPVERVEQKAGDEPTQAASTQPPSPPGRVSVAPVAPQETGTEAHGRAPLTLRVSGPPTARAGDVVEIEIAVDRPRPTTTPMRLKVVVPPGAELVEGETEETITDSASSPIRRTLVLRLSRVPSDDLQVSLDVRESSHGAHATGAYRFGRPEPKLAQPPRSPKRTVIGGRDFGRAIPLSPPGGSGKKP